PTNVERATPEHVRRNLADWDSNLLKLRAVRLQVSEQEAALVGNKPLFLIHAEARAKAEGCQVETILEQYADEFVYSKYPTPECFLPNEVAEYVKQGTLPVERLGHTDLCSACSMLLASFLPKDLDDILTGFQGSKKRSTDETNVRDEMASSFRLLT